MELKAGEAAVARVPWVAPLRDGMLKGAPAFLLGGGPSVKMADTWALAKTGAFRLAVNMSYTLGCDAVLFGDYRAVELADAPPLKFGWRSCDVPKMLAGFDGKHCLPKTVLEQVEWLPPMATWSRHMIDGLVMHPGGGNNTGLAALNLLDILGAGTVYLVGFDFAPGPKDATQNWHTFYPADWRQGDYPAMVKAFEYHAQDLKARVFNCSPNSRLRCFPFVAFDDALLDAAKR